MNHTEAIITLDMSPPGTREKASLDGDRKPWVRWESLMDDEDYQPKLATGEPGLFRLDGGYRLFPDDPYNTPGMGYYGPTLSREDGSCETTLTILFSQPVDVTGLTMCFGDAVASDFTVQWYAGGSTTTQPVTGNTQRDRYVPIRFSGCTRIVITFLKTDAPHRYVKLRKIVFGRKDRLALTGASLLDEYDPLCNTLPIGTLTMTAINTDQRYNMLNPNGVYHDLRETQRVIVRELVQNDTGSAEYKMGRYYLEGWENSNTATAKLTAVDAIGLFDKTPFFGRRFNDPKEGSVPASVYFADAFQAAGFEDYRIAPEVANLPLSGYIREGTVRTALQQLCVATRSTVKVGRDGVVDVYRPAAKGSPLRVEKQLSAETITTKTAAPEIGVKWYTFSRTRVCGEVYHGLDSPEWVPFVYDFTSFPLTLYPADNFTSPIAQYLFLPDKVKYVNFGNGTGGVEPEELPEYIRGFRGELNAVSFDAQVSGRGTAECGWEFWGDKLDAVEGVWPPNCGGTVISDNTLITSEDQAKEIAEYWRNALDAQRLELSYRMVLDPRLETGGQAEITTAMGTQLPHLVTSLDIDLTGGFLANAKGVTSLVAVP